MLHRSRVTVDPETCLRRSSDSLRYRFTGLPRDLPDLSRDLVHVHSSRSGQYQNPTTDGFEEFWLKYSTSSKASLYRDHGSKPTVRPRRTLDALPPPPGFAGEDEVPCPRDADVRTNQWGRRRRPMGGGGLCPE